MPETIEASLQLSEAALVGLGVPTGPVIASIHEKRDEFRHELQEAAGQAGQTETRSIRAKTLREATQAACAIAGGQEFLWNPTEMFALPQAVNECQLRSPLIRQPTK